MTPRGALTQIVRDLTAAVNDARAAGDPRWIEYAMELAALLEKWRLGDPALVKRWEKYTGRQALRAGGMVEVGQASPE